MDTRILSSCPALESASLASTAVRITAAPTPSSALATPLITTAGTPIIISIIFVVVVTLRRLWLGPMQPLLRTIYHILDSCDVDTNLEFPVSGVFATLHVGGSMRSETQSV